MLSILLLNLVLAQDATLNVSKIPATLDKLNFQQDLSTCVCDLTWNYCDVQCCCDPDCTDSDKELFLDQCVADELQAYVCQPDLLKANRVDGVHRQGGLCVAINNSPIENFYFNDPTIITNDATFLDAVSDYDTVPVMIAQNNSNGYKYSQYIQTQISTTFSKLAFTQVDLDGTCADDNDAEFGINKATQCIRPITDTSLCAANTPLDPDYYVGSMMLLSGFALDVVTIQKPTFLAPVFANGKCSNYVTKITWNITYSNEGIITNALFDAQVDSGALAVGGFIQQQFAINFIKQNTFEVPIKKSGNPGYLNGYNLLAGSSQTINGHSFISLVNPLSVVSYSFDQSSNYFVCEGNSRVPITFNENLDSSCVMKWSFADLRDNCQQIRMLVFNYQMQSISAATHIGIFGNSSMYMTNEWIPILFNLPATVNQTNAADGNNGGSCSNLLTDLKIQITTASVGTISSPQNIVTGIYISAIPGSFDYQCRRTMDCMAQDILQEFRLSATVEFISIDTPVSMKVPPPPGLLPPLPDDVFYPFKAL